MELLYASLVRAGGAVLRLMNWPVQVSGGEHLPVDGPAVVAANHVSYLDPVVLGWAVTRHDRYPRFLAKRELFHKPVLGSVMRRLHHVPVDRSGMAASHTLDHGAELLRRGEVIAVFPEGTISTSFVPATPQRGAAGLALAAGAPLVPCALWGGQRIATKGRPRQLRRGVTLTARFGPPVPYTAGEDPDAVTQRLWESVRGLVDDLQREYPDHPGENERWWLPRHLGGTAPTPEEAGALRDEERLARRRARTERQTGHPTRRFRPWWPGRPTRS